jgi:4-methylaminobutanoate oxidase (formaldehyde-forming)
VTNSEKRQVVIIGGGILGLACAYYLQCRDDVQVTVLEAGEFAAATTSQAAALLTRARGDLNASLFVAETHDVIKRFERDRRERLMRRSGCWHLADGDYPRTTLALYRQLAQQQTSDIQSSLVHDRNAADISATFPWINIAADASALAYLDDGYIDPYQLAIVYMQQAKLNGVRFLANTKVKGLETKAGKICAVRSADEIFECDDVLLAAGPWSKTFAREYGVTLAMATVRSHYWITDFQTMVSRDMPMLIDQENGFYFRSENGALLFGVRDSQGCYVDANHLPDDIHSLGFGQDPQGWAALEENWQALIERCPLLEQAQLNHYIAGVSSYTPDGKPLLGKAPGWQNFYVASGCSGAGIAWSGGIGKAMAATITRESCELDIQPYRLDRFSHDTDVFSDEFQQQCAAARSQKRTG